MVTRQEVINKSEFFSEVRLWPLLEELDPERWLSNFLATEEEFAIHLLDSFMYYSEELSNALFRSAFHSLSKHRIRTPDPSILTFDRNWQQFVDSAIFTYVTGEHPRPTDSGHAFARKARQLLGIDDERIVSPDEAMLRTSLRNLPIVFVDDFVGSGDQFIHTWHRRIRLSQGHEKTFQEIVHETGIECFYVPLVATQYGLREIAASCNGCKVLPAHLLSDDYSALHPHSLIWPEHLRGGAPAFLKAASERACIPDLDGNEGDWRGFHKLGLTIAFHHKVPDATLPLFTWNENNWKPLVRGRA